MADGVQRRPRPPNANSLTPSLSSQAQPMSHSTTFLTVFSISFLLFLPAFSFHSQQS